MLYGAEDDGAECNGHKGDDADEDVADDVGDSAIGIDSANSDCDVDASKGESNGEQESSSTQRDGSKGVAAKGRCGTEQGHAVPAWG